MLGSETSMRHLSLASALTLLLLQLLLLTIGRCRPALAADNGAAAARSELACDAGSRFFEVAANSSWQSVTVLAAAQDFSGDCSIVFDMRANTLNGTPSAGWSAPSSALQPRQQQPGLLLKLENVQLGPSSAACDYTGNTLNIFVQNTNDQTGYICNVTTSVYMWASQAIKLYIYILSGSNSSAPYFAAAFINVDSPINICQQQLIANGSSPSAAAALQIDDEAYLFAPDTRYVRIPPNNATCAPDVNYTLTIAANSSTSPASLNLTVLAAPPNGSCWSLLLDGLRRRSGDTLSIAAGVRITLVYARDGGGSANPGGCLSSLSSGFTVRATVVVLATGAAANTTTASPSGSSLRANSTVASFTAVNSTTTGLSVVVTSFSTSGLNGSLPSAVVATGSSSSGGTTTVPLFAVAIGCSFAGGVVIAAVACAVAALLAAHRNRKHRGQARKATLYSTNEGKTGRSKAKASNADGSQNVTYSKDFDTDI